MSILNLAALAKRDNSFTYANLCSFMYAKILLYCDTESFNSKEIICVGGERHLTIIRLMYM